MEKPIIFSTTAIIITAIFSYTIGGIATRAIREWEYIRAMEIMFEQNTECEMNIINDRPIIKCAEK